MTAPGGGDPYRDQPGPWQQYQHPPVDPREPVNYPEYYPGPPPGQPPPYGYPPTPPMYSNPYNPYQPYPPQTNGMAIASLITSILGVVFGIPLAIFCYIGWVIPVVGAVLGGVALNQIKRTGQQGRGLAIAGIVIGAGTAALLLFFMVMYAAAMMHAPMFGVV
ncbi:DUF4190 domain-containing protein [Candidatus Mycobacterium wuenschmannii]|uniref:DUF4190 domain-containing protein n=1 Tax=Candidatus Mycobacterium wuenschmannii TaxID=3027808 RepID=A0ABY8W605_9MYCO|nr:DUF4190 domain-containing protein [Candidatus Mycobacterium wuenschmannii]WIM89887.1 DUF4190 domain-containing protein [Candidatus Mycobacterium wuenschmannii]